MGEQYPQVIVFSTWETLPDGSVAIPNLAQLHPTAVQNAGPAE